ncbi:MAG: hypothetical protein ACXWKW_08095 [Asticcacaulis sp.]
MSDQAVATSSRMGRIGRSFLALLAGFVVNIVLTIVTDLILHVASILPAQGSPINDVQSALAALYRTVYAVLGSYLVARLAPGRPMGHALLGAAIGMVLATLGAVATWNLNLSPHWYPVSLIVLALPAGWAGARIWKGKTR